MRMFASPHGDSKITHPNLIPRISQMEPWLKPTFADLRSASPGFAEVVHSVAVNAEEVTVAKADSSFEGLRGQIQARRDDGNGEC